MCVPQNHQKDFVRLFSTHERNAAVFVNKPHLGSCVVRKHIPILRSAILSGLIVLCAAALAKAEDANQGEPEIVAFKIMPADTPNEGILFVDHTKANRSGHLGHALVEYAEGKILAFYPSCSGAKGGLRWMGPEWAGHNADGWMEYKRSEDGGQTWSEASVLEYSKSVYDKKQGRSVFSEKAVLAPDGSILLFNLECDISTNTDWNPTFTPTFLRSTDGGKSWEQARKLGDVPARIFAAICVKDTIFVLSLHQKEKLHVLYVSTDNGKTFVKRSQLPFKGRVYGTLAVLGNGHLIAYVYNAEDEQRLDYAISPDFGMSWGESQTTFFAKRIRNPQIAAFKGGYVMHGRSGHLGRDNGDLGHLVLYTSKDGLNWDEGRYLRKKTAGNAAYSNNLLLGGGKRLLIQASHAYEHSKANVLHWWLE
jgi:hypothetical protein